MSAVELTCEDHRVPPAAEHLAHRPWDPLHQLGSTVAGQLVGLQAELTAVTLAKRVQATAS